MLNQIMDSFFSKLTEKLVDCVVDSLAKNNLESTLEDLKNNLNSLISKAYDVEEKIKEAGLSGNKKRIRQVEEWLNQVKLIENKFRTLKSEVQTQGFVRKFISCGQATPLRIEVDKLIEQSRHIGSLVNVYERRGQEFLRTKMSGQGFKRNLNRIWNLLKSDQVSSIGIYGMGGVGKTALARHINNIILEKRNEMRVFWITVSQTFNIKKLQDEIARSIGINLSEEDDEDKRAARLHQTIGNNFILILDDVWQNISLEKLGDPLRLEGCKLILTTRSIEVCWQMGCQEKVEVGKLCKEEAWNLFKEKLGQDVALCPEVENVARLMAKFCDGLPLGIIVLAGTMRGKTSIHVWRNELEKLRALDMEQAGEEDKVFKVLKFSFDGLPPNHQLCLLHCSLYPEDSRIRKDKLVKRFILDGLVDKRKSRRSQLDEGHAMLNKLVAVSLLENVEASWMRMGGGVKMHDLIRAMALRITKQTNMVKSGLELEEISNEEEWIKDFEKVSFMCNKITEIPNEISPDCPNLTTLILSNNPLASISDSFFSRLGSLCSLDLSRTEISKLPNSLCNLKNLEALNLKRCENLEYIPDLGKLKKLRNLNLSGTAIKEVPQGMEELVNLRSLSLENMKFLDNLPEGLFLKFSYLHYLHLAFHIQAPEGILRLKHLEEYEGPVKSMSEFNECVGLRQNQWISFRILVSGRACDDNDDECLWNCVKLKHMVRVQYIDLKNEGIFVHDINYLALKECEGLSKSLVNYFSKLEKPCSLERLEIDCCEGIECFRTSEELELQFLHFQNLRSIELYDLENFVGLIQNTDVAIGSSLPRVAIFCSLQVLEIRSCHKMRKLGLPLSELQNLEQITICSCYEIEEIVEARDGEGQVVTLPKLKRLTLWDLPKLKSICNRTMFCASIEEIDLFGCPELKKLQLSEFPNLEKINIRNCDKIEEIIDVSSSHELELQFLPFQNLRRIELFGLKNFVGLIQNTDVAIGSSLPQATIFCSLQVLTISRCDKMRKLGLPLSEFQNLEEITIDGCKEIEEIVEARDGEEQLVTLPKLKRLTLWDLPRLKSICNRTMSYASIEEIDLRRCPKLKKLHWSEFPNLKTIYIGDCYKTEEIIDIFSSHELELKFLPFQNRPSTNLCLLKNTARLIQLTDVAIGSSLSQVTIFCSLRVLYIFCCDKMRKLGLPLFEFQNLENITIEECMEIKEIVEARYGEEQLATLPKLKRLTLWVIRD